MRKVILTLLALMVLCVGFAFADTTSLTIASIVKDTTQINPSIIIGIGSAELTYYVNPDQELTEITGLNLTQDGSFTFALMTSEEVVINSESQKYGLTIEIQAEGFHLYDYNYNASMEGSSRDEMSIKQLNAVPLTTTNPEVEIPSFYGANENVTVYHSGGRNRIEIQFDKGRTKAELILGTFSIDWKGKRPLEAGIYKAKVNVIYSTP